MRDKSKTILVVLVVAILGVGVVMATKNNDSGDHPDTMTTHNTDAKDDTSTKEVQQTNSVTYKGFDVLPKSIKIKKGTTVTWTNEDTAKHDVTPDTETAEFKASELFGKGESYEVTFNTVGTYTYYCSPHPYMKGSIEVVE